MYKATAIKYSSVNTETLYYSVCTSTCHKGMMLLDWTCQHHVRGGADKSLAKPERKQATATKLRIYSSYSPWSSLHFLATQKNAEGCPSNQVTAAAMTSASKEKWWPSNCFFQSMEQVVVQRGQIQRRGWVVKTLEAQIGQFLPGWKCLVSQGIVMQEQDTLGDPLTAFFLQNVLQLHQHRWVILRIDSLALWKIISDEKPSWCQKVEARTFPAGFCTRKFWGLGGATWAAMLPLHWLLPCLQVIVT